MDSLWNYSFYVYYTVHWQRWVYIEKLSLIHVNTIKVEYIYHNIHFVIGCFCFNSNNNQCYACPKPKMYRLTGICKVHEVSGTSVQEYRSSDFGVWNVAKLKKKLCDIKAHLYCFILYLCWKIKKSCGKIPHFALYKNINVQYLYLHSKHIYLYGKNIFVCSIFLHNG